MALKLQDDTFSHVIAIDFGTGASGYGICPRLNDQNEQLRIEVFNPCDENDDQKTPTAILFDNNGNFLDFGSNAIIQYSQILEDDETAMIFQNYKMHLLNLNKNAKSLDDRELPLLTIISETLKYIAQKALDKLEEQIGEFSKQKIKWVITVPALWNEEHKLFMRQAAIQAGLINNQNDQNLILCLEPEGASIQCREDSEDTLKKQMTKDSVIMVLDCGGGTVDITIHKLLCEVNEKFLCQELIPSSGGCQWGSKYVDIFYENFLKEFLGEELFQYYMKNSLARLDILKDFEIVKRKYKGTQNERSLAKFSYLGEKLCTQKLQTIIQQYNERSPKEYALKLKGSANVELPSKLVSSFFLPLFENIKDKVQQLINEVKLKNEKIDFIFLVGGFSENNFLKQEIKQQFENQGIKILIPRRPQISVIRGACMYGLNPRSINSRIAKFTYGINTLTNFDAKKYPQEKKVVIDGEDFCEDVFDAFVKKGDSVGSDEFHSKIYCPVRTKQTFMRIIFYSTEKKDVQFIDEEGVSKLGELQIDIGKHYQNIEQKTVRVTLKFGTTYIYAQATNKDGSVIKNCEFKFDSN